MKVLKDRLRPFFACAIIGVALLSLLGSCVTPVTQGPAANQPATQTAVTTTVVTTSTVASTETVSPATTVATRTQQITPTVGVTATTATTHTGSSSTTSSVSSVAAVQEKYKDIPVGFTKEGFAYRGNPDAPITMLEYSDYQCPFCERYFVQTEAAVDEAYVRSGKMRVIFRDFPLVQLHPNAPAAANAALCVADQGATKFWSMHDQLFRTQAEWANLADPKPYFLKLVQAAGLDATQYTKCMTSNAKAATIEQSLAEGQKVGINGTPSFQFVRAATKEVFPLVGAQPYDQFANLIDALVAGKKPEQPQAQAPAAKPGDQKIPVWATAEGLKPDPKRPGYDMAGDEIRGNPDAKVVVVEFSDFQCPFCRRHVQETQPTLDKTFVDTNKIFWVFKNFPLSIHPQAPAAAIAAECASDQNKFWEMHDILFKDATPWSISDPNPIFSGFAKQLGLNGDQFTKCLSDTSDSSAQARVKSDMQDGAQFVQGTPTFIVLFGGQGRIIPGALPVDRFTKVLQDAIDGKMK